MASQTQAKYKCKKCNTVWECPPRPVECPACGHVYVEWLNYEEMAKNKFK